MTPQFDADQSAIIRKRTAPGAAPGTIVVDPDAPPCRIHAMAFGPEGFQEQAIEAPHDLAPLLQQYSTVWINVDGLGDKEVIQQLGTMFELHRLALEDVVNVHQRPKIEDYTEQLFFVARMVYGNGTIQMEQLSMFIGENYVLTFQERAGGDCFDPVRDRLRKGVGRIRSYGADYLAYCLIDALVDAYFPIIEVYGDHLEALEDEVLESPTPSIVAEIHQARRDLLLLRRAIWPLREAINALLRDQAQRFSEETRVHLRDCYDHSIQILDFVESYRELVSDLMDVYLSSLSARMNEVMRVLTVIATIFIPLTFISSVYGMNFNTEASWWNMPELNWPIGYPLVLAVMGAVAIGQLIFFWRRGWLGTALDARPKRRSETDEAPKKAARPGWR